MIDDYRKKYENLEYGKIINVSKNFIIVKCGSGLIKLKNIVPKLSVKKVNIYEKNFSCSTSS